MSRLSLLVIGILTAVLLSCTPSGDVLRMVEHGDYSEVHPERYSGRGKMVYPPSDYDSMVEKQRKRLERDPKLMNELSATFYPREAKKAQAVVFEYWGISVNEEMGEVVLWYMGPIIRPKIDYGYRVQWVYDLKKMYLTRAHVSVVPIE